MKENYLKSKLASCNAVRFHIIIAQPTCGKTYFKEKYQGRNTIILDIDDVNHIIKSERKCSGWDLVELVSKDMPNLSLSHNEKAICKKDPDYLYRVFQLSYKYIYQMLSYTTGPNVEIYLMSWSINHLYTFYTTIRWICDNLSLNVLQPIDISIFQREISSYIKCWTERQESSRARNAEFNELDLQIAHMKWSDDVTLNSDSFNSYLEEYDKEIQYYELIDNEWISDVIPIEEVIHFNDFNIDSVIHSYEVKTIIYVALRDFIMDIEEHDIDKLDRNYNLSTWISDGFEMHKDGTNGQYHHKESWRQLFDIIHAAADWVSASYRNSKCGLNPSKYSFNNMSVNLDSLLSSTLQEFKSIRNVISDKINEMRVLIKGSHKLTKFNK